MASFQEVFPGVLSLVLPLPFELESVNVYLVALEDGYLLMDCGMETDPAFDTLRGAMDERGIECMRQSRGTCGW
jgi:glyoxylase-like metal-dependent hydrolase (beta-lactamase superfamily II)